MTLVVIALLAVACTQGKPASDTSDASTTATAEATDPLERAAAYVDAHLGEADPATQVITANVARRFGITSLAHWRDEARQRFDTAKPTDGPFVAINRRILDPNAVVSADAIDALPHTTQLEFTNWVLSTALHCDQPYFPASWSAIVSDALAADPSGGYPTTHVGLALLAMDDRGCDVVGEDALRARTVEQLTSAIASSTHPDDLTLERLVVLHELQPKVPIDRTWLDRVRGAQRPDGGWARNEGDTESDWHTTLLAMWLLAAADSPGARTPIVA